MTMMIVKVWCDAVLWDGPRVKYAATAMVAMNIGGLRRCWVMSLENMQWTDGIG